ncbi:MULTISPECIES: glycoside hydrolase family 25 protein [unclassified Chryseobacterium]|uniref:glycoside hydrolase family 25 protein n=1 Tax=unclassified Chryseobacterium TaxID=2593645 RepID=UPI00100AC0D6|nr:MULTISPECIES: GH25 family lysozyme [unclassified Chryseobacterium]RXM52652.1 glycoside hydrolase [Chryseobacterium sp. CH25]RXM66709.1 glycoside hydrolase [Chryseobacterium sp. CH1]
MTPKKYTKKTAKQIHKNRRNNYFFRRRVILAILIVALIGTGFYLKQSVSYYYALYFNKFTHKKLHNSERESSRIQRILANNLDKTYGFDVSHYQNKEDIKWDSLSIGNKTIPLEFVVMRATMGNKSADKHFDEFWEMAKKHNLIRGAYHFYRADEDPVIQANNFLANVKLESGDLPPILDIEKIPKRKTNKKLVEDLKVWCKIVEEAYGEKPIIYTYYHYHKDFLKGEFKGYPLWLANYNDVPTPSPDDQWDFWQFTENGIVHGINTKVDLDIYNGNSWSLKRLTLD